jgi:hypothetical protein
VTSAHNVLNRIIAVELNGVYQIRLTAPVHVEAPCEFFKSALNYDELTNLAVRGVDAIGHVAERLPDIGNVASADAVGEETSYSAWVAPRGQLCYQQTCPKCGTAMARQ